MPRNSSGAYTLVAGNPVVPDTLIQTGWANPTLADVAQALTDSLDRNGRGGMLAPLKFADGTLAAPGISFLSESSTGFFHPSTGLLNAAIQGALALSLSAAGLAVSAGLTVAGATTLTGATTIGGALAVTGPVTLTGGISGVLSLPLGTAPLPSLTFTGDPNTGMYSPGADQIAWATAGAMRGTVSPAGNWLIAAPSSGITLQLVNTLEALRLVGTNTMLAGFNAANTVRTGFLQFDATGVFLAADGTLPVTLYTGGANRMVIGTTGNVTINAPTAGVPLTLNGNGTAAPQLSLTGQPTGQAVGFYTTSLSAGARNWALLANQVAFGDFMLRQGNALGADPITAGSDALYISGGRNVTINAPANIGSGPVLTVNTVGSTQSIAAFKAPAGAHAVISLCGNNTTPYVDAFDIQHESSGIIDFIGRGATSQLAFYTNGTLRQTIAAAGQVSIAQTPNTLPILTVGDNTTNGQTAIKAAALEIAFGKYYVSSATEMLSAASAGIVLATSVVAQMIFMTNNVTRWSISGAGIITSWQQPTNASALEVATIGYVPGGQGRTWQNMTGLGGRAMGAVITSPAYPIEICIGFNFPATAGTIVTLGVGGVAIAARSNGATAGAFSDFMMAVIPPNTNYQITTATGVATIGTWAELR